MIELGDTVKDTVSEISGIAIGRTQWINGCIRFVVQPKATKNVMPEAVSIDEPQLVVVKKAAKSKAKDIERGGPMPVPARGHQV